jgi:pyruvate formate lyase activating enzyme
MPRDEGVIRGSRFSAAEVVARARETGCRSISYTYTEPTIFFEYAHECARLASAAGLKNVFVTNGYMTREALDLIGADLHAANVDLKGFTDTYYRDVVGARLKPVLDSIRRMVERDIWVEVTTLLIPGLNDGDEELHRLAAFLASLSPDIPWHVSRFHPTYRMLDVPPTPTSSIERALRIGREEGLRYVYGGNLPGHDSESTRCPCCGNIVIERRGFSIQRTRLEGNRCRECGADIPLVLT